ncbi:cytochrome P450 oxidoreductase [Ilyonectria destructans]|nr:cytochrome P450 oxidoreductase [Ilyonectria destructans]
MCGITTEFVKSESFKLGAFTDDKGEYIDDPFSTKDGKIHSRLNIGAANAYSLNNVVKMEPFINKVTDRLLNMLDEHAETKKVCNLGDILKYYAMDTIFAITFGKDFNYLEKGDHLDLYYVLDVFTHYMAIFGQISWCHKFLLKNPRLAGWVAGNTSSHLEMMDLAIRETEASSEKPYTGDPATFLQLLVMNQQQNPKSITDDEIHGNALGNISAGSDTTAIALRSVFYYPLKSPKAYDKLCDEVCEKLTLPVDFQAANELVYLNACISEAMRMHPSVGMILGREVPPGGALISGHHIGEGVESSLIQTFKPERWTESETSEEHLKLMNRRFLTFGHGLHTCSGRHISLLETTKLIPTLLLMYDIEFENDGKGYGFKNRWFMTQWGLNVFFSRREVE